MSLEPSEPDFAKRGGLIPAVVQDGASGQVLMLAWVNELAWKRTRETGRATFWSTSRQELWEKGATSGDWLLILELRVDCDLDSLLYIVQPQGAGACHTKNSLGKARASCFYRRVEADGTLTNLDL
jgi:phosphoribosyl-AMP cyclohydrolase